MNALTLTPSKIASMTSLEMAELVEKRHDNVKRTIETLVDQGVIVRPQNEDVPGTDAIGRSRTTQAYVFTGEQGKRDSIIVVAQLSPEFTARLVDRWMELESGAPALPQNLPDALRLAADLAEQKAQAEAALAIAGPKADALDLICAGTEAVTVTQASKLLGLKVKELTAWMHANRWVYRQNGTWVAYDQHIRNGRLLYKEARYTDQKTGQECYSPYCHILPKGLTILAKHFTQGAA